METSLTDIAEFHKSKFGDVPAQLQLAKILEEHEEMLNAPTLDEMLKECCDVILATVGLFNAYNADIEAYMQECINKVRNRNYPDKFRHLD